jgi:NADPH:quinone reductase
VSTTVSSEAKATLALDLGAELTVRYRQEDFVAATRDWTGGHGLDVALDNVGPDVMQRTFAAMSPYGRIVTLTGTPADTSDRAAYNGNLSIHNVMMLTPMWHGLRPHLRRQADRVRKAMALLAERKLRILVDRVFPLAEAAAAHRHLESGLALGKVVVAI